MFCENIKCMMLTLKLCLLQPLLWSVHCSTVFSLDHERPYVYRKTECSKDEALIYYQYKTFGDCQRLCASTQLCGLINYNPLSKLCILQGHGANQTTLPGRCISVRVNSNDSNNLLGACAYNQCDINSMCVSTWNQTGFICVPALCSAAPSIEHATLLQSTYSTLGGRNAYNCDTGYTGVGNPGIQCVGNGTWTATDFACWKNCPPIPVKASADLVTWFPLRLFFNTTVIYACKSGYYNLSHPSITCDETGSWSNFDCLPYCYHATLPNLPNGEALPGNEYIVDMSAEYACDSGYYNYTGEPTVFCDATGSWSPLQVECLPYCYQASLPPLANGMALPGDIYTIDMTSEYTCDHGYYLSPGDPHLSCDVTGSWSSLQIQCYMHCSDPEDPTKGHITSMPTSPFVDGSTAEYECHDGYYSYHFDTPRRIICETSGDWTYHAECYKHCGDVPGPPTASELDRVSTPPPYTVDTYVKYKCWLTNYLAADKEKKCNKHGHWDNVVVCCVHGWDYDWSSGDCKLFR